MAIKILMLNYEFPPLGGGASPVGYEIVKRLSETGDFDIDIVTMGYKNLPTYEEINRRLRVYRMKCWRSRKEICYPWEQLTYIWSAKRFLRRRLRVYTYDVSHAHFIIPTGIISLWLKKKYGLSYIITSHGSDVPGFNTDRFKVMHKFTGPILRKICRGADLIITPSMYLKSLVLKNIDGNLQSKMKVIPNGIDKDKFVSKEKQRIILASGRLLPRKGFQYLVQAVSNKDLGYEVHICGDGPLRRKLKQMSAHSRTKIIFHGWLDNNGNIYRNLLERAAIYCLPSLRENASIALLEAMSAGCAIVTTNVAGCSETIGDDGILVEPFNVESLKRGLDRLICDSNLLVCLQERARRRVEKTFDWNILIQKYKLQLDLYVHRGNDCKIKVCFVASQIFAWGKIGGFGTMTRNTAIGLLGRDFDVYAVVLKRKGQKSLEVLDGINVCGVNFLNPLSAIKTFRRINADIYHSEEPFIGTFFARIAQPCKKHIISFIDPRDLTDWFTEISYYAFSKKILFPIYYLFEMNFCVRWAVRGANKLCVQAKFIEPKARKIYKIKSGAEILFLPNPIKSPRGEIIKAKMPTVLFLARLDKRKRPELVLQMVSRFPHVHFHIVGKAHDKDYDAYLNAKYKHLHNLTFHGFIDQYKDKVFDKILKESWILINTSKREGLPAAFLEAISYDCAILSCNNPDGFSEKFGYFVRDDDFERGLHWLLENNRWRELGLYGRNYFLENYKWNKAVDRHVSLYRHMLHEEGK